MAKRLDKNKVVQRLPYNESLWTLNEKALRKEIVRLSSIANKRIDRLMDRDWADSPALKSLFENDAVTKSLNYANPLRPKFSVKGKTHKEVQQLASKLTKFLRAETSTVRGATADIKSIADTTGITYESVTDLKVKAKKFFELASKIQQYLRSQQDAAAALNYQKIWNQINQYTKEQQIDLSEASVSVDSLLNQVDDIIKKTRKRTFEHMDGFEDFDLL